MRVQAQRKISVKYTFPSLHSMAAYMTAVRDPGIAPPAVNHVA